MFFTNLLKPNSREFSYLIISSLVFRCGAHYFRKRLRVRLHGHKSGEEDGMRSRSLVCKCLRTSQFKSAIEWYTKRKKYFRFALVVPGWTIQQPRDTRSKVCPIRKSALQISLGSPSSPLPFSYLFFLLPHACVSLSSGMRSSALDTFSDKRNAICSL